MKKITIIWLILIILLTLLLTLIGFSILKKNKPYKEIEADIVEAMKVYYGQDSNLKKLPTKNREIKITIAELKKFGIKINTKVKNDSCTGFGIVKGKDVAHTYHGFIKCNKYETEEYNTYKKIK